MAGDSNGHGERGQGRGRTIAKALNEPAPDGIDMPEGDGFKPVGPEQPFAPRPYPRREAGASPLRGCRVLVIDEDVQRGRGWAVQLSSRAAASRHHSGGDGLADLLDGRDQFDVILVPTAQVDEEDVEALSGVTNHPTVVLVGSADWAEDRNAPVLSEDPSTSDLAIGVARALEARSLARENRALRDQLEDRFSFGNVVTRDSTLRGALSVLESVAETRATVLILGETGTGKSLLARTLHQASDRKNGAYVEVNCGALPEGLLEAELFGHAKGSFTGATSDRPGRFEAADGGTIFLDEIDSAPLDLQVKLLRVVQDRVFERVGESRTRSSDVRIVAATNASLEGRVKDGSFREDLYWRLKVVEVRIPPLRERPRDLAPLAEAFVERFATEYQKPIKGLAPRALGALARAWWPGNVRQLEHALERAVLLAGPFPEGSRSKTPHRLDDRDLVQLDPPDFRPPPGFGERSGQAGEPLSPVAREGAAHPREELLGTQGSSLQTGLRWLEELTGGAMSLKEALEGPERLLIEGALRRHAGRRDLAASDLEINRSTLFNKMRKYDLLHVDFTRPATRASGDPRPSTSRPSGSVPPHRQNN